MMNVKQRDVCPGKETSILYVDSWSQRGRKQGVALWKHERDETKRCVEPAANVTSSLSTLLGMRRQTFKMQQQLSFPKPCADIWDCGQHAPRWPRKWDGGQGCFLSAKDTGDEMDSN